MYKAMHQCMRESEKLADISDFAFRTWEMGVVASDVTGRITAKPRLFHAQAYPLVKADEAKVAAALKELEDASLAHRYEVDGKSYLVFHDHDEHNKTMKNLRSQRPECPPPPPNLCYCVTYREGEEVGDPVEAEQGAENSPVEGVPPIDAESATDRRKISKNGPPIGVHVHVQDPVHVPLEAEGDPKGEVRKNVVTQLARLWNQGPGEHLNGRSAGEKIQAALDVGVSAAEIEQAFWNYKAIKGRKIWEVLDPLRPRMPSPGVPSAHDILASFGKEKTA